jgi:predicted dehydrogenase
VAGSRLKIGLIGGGAIAQIQYLPILSARPDEFEIGGVADLSRDLLNALGERYHIPQERLFQDYRDLVQSDIDAVVVCSSGSHAPPTIAAAEAGKHVLVEKPMCTTVEEANQMVAAADAAGVVLMVAYMKRYDPAYRYAKARISEMDDVRFIQVNHLHPDNSLHVAEFNVMRFNDIPPDSFASAAGGHAQQVAAALGFPSAAELPADILRAYTIVLGSMIHDIGNLHGVFGPPSRVLSTEIWSDGNGITTTLEYPEGKRAVCTWIDLPELWDFKETLEVYGSRDRVIASFPTGFSIGQPSTVTQYGMDADRTPWRKELSWHENAFERELEHFRQCVLTGQSPETTGRDGVHDIALVRDIILAYLQR